MKRLLAWFEARLGLGEALQPMLAHPIPRGAAGPLGWFYVFGSASLTLLLLQILTGIGLALVYVPTADNAYESLLYLNSQQPLGGFLRAVHNWSALAMVVMVVLHMTQVFLFGAFKYPRELTWVLGVFLLLLTVGMAFTGQVLRWDSDAYWGVGVGASMAGRVPVIGPYLVRLLLGGPVIGGDTLSRFFALHVFVLPGMLLVVLALHLWLVLRKGVSEPPEAGKPVDPKTYDIKYHEELKRGVPFLGDAVWRDGIFSALVVLGVVVMAAVLGPKGPSAPPDPALSGANPRPDWPFLWIFALLALLPPEAETAVILIVPPLAILFLFAIPFLFNKGERAPSRRPLAVLAVILIFTVIGMLTYQGATSPWSPVMDAWSGDPVPPNLLKGKSPLQLQGAVVLQNKQCRNCHALEGQGGHRGPDLTDVGTRLTRDELVRQVIQGGGNMPAYGKQLRPAEVTALVDFLVSLRPEGQKPAEPPLAPPARDAGP
jgi:ubiquinol-cytochrome c reductase cytochrome b subunit